MEIIRVAFPARGFGKAPEKPLLSELLRPHGIEICHIGQGPWRPGHGDVLLVNGNLNWYPAIKRQLLSEELNRLPPVVIWHSEPLPPPRASGLPWPWLDHR